ncbi:MAG: outer membrane lipoprotein-sorting protein [Kiritimatiellae bacterium]|nr:outer membrane lipoprotein-sorting protein [Kiritimatiellia bacterium]
MIERSFKSCLAAAVCAMCVFLAAYAHAEELSAAQVLANCQAMLPTRPVELNGAIVLRNRKGIVRSEYGYRLVLDRSKAPAEADLTICERGGTNVLKHVTLKRPGAIPEGNVMDTDVTWLDLSLDYLWWTNPRYEAEREGESVHGQKCSVILVDPPDAAASGVKAVRLWADKKNGCLMQAETLDANSRAVRRLWGTRVKKFGERWMANVLETETLGSGRRTKITVEELRELP